MSQLILLEMFLKLSARLSSKKVRSFFFTENADQKKHKKPQLDSFSTFFKKSHTMPQVPEGFDSKHQKKKQEKYALKNIVRVAQSRKNFSAFSRTSLILRKV